MSHVPQPLVQPGKVVIANRASLVSAGTEKTAMELARKSIVGKALDRPDQVRRVLEKLRNEGFFQTLAQVRERLDEPTAMGYSSAGVVLACGEGVQSFKPGDRVASNGPHAGVVCVPKHLCAHVPPSVSFDQAAFAVLGAIALQGVRLSRVNLGETVLVIGLGLIGQLTVALLRQAGVRVLGTDLDPTKCELATTSMGAAEARPSFSANDVLERTRGLGVDAVLITASTKSNGPIEMAANAVRSKGRVILVGVVGLELDRRPFYFKEAEFAVSCSYGPGRYDPEYEEQGHDYPAGHVRWTEQRNIQAVLDLMGSGRLDVSPLISHHVPIDQAEDAYALINHGKEPYLGILLEYPDGGRCVEIPRLQLSPVRSHTGKLKIGCLGAGNFARLVLLPAIKRVAAFHPQVLCSAAGLNATHTGTKLGFEMTTTDEDRVFADPQVDAVFVVTRHSHHSRQVIKALQAGKHVFVEKPLALTVEELEQIERALQGCCEPRPLLMVGFNRRFSPAALKVRAFYADVKSPVTVSVRFNAGAIPADHWTQDRRQGGGRIIGEACHGIDLATFLVNSPPVRVYAESIGGPNAPQITEDQCFITVRHANGSISQIAYLAGGDKAFPKERVEMFGGGRLAVIDDFRDVVLCVNGKVTRQRSSQQDKGHGAELDRFAEALTNGSSEPIPWHELRSVTLAAILAERSIREGMPFDVP